MKIGSKVRIIKAIPTPDQNELDLNNYIGLECEVMQHWKQSGNKGYWNDGQIQVSIIAIGTIVLNKGEYKEIKER